MYSLSLTNKEIEEIYYRHVDTVYRICFLYLKGNLADIEDAIQTTFVKVLNNPANFQSSEHEKAWLIVTASNVCKDMLSSVWKKRVIMNDSLLCEQVDPAITDDTIESIMKLPDHYKTSIYMFYYEGYSCKEIAKALGKTEVSIWGYLHKGRKMLSKELGEDI